MIRKTLSLAVVLFGIGFQAEAGVFWDGEFGPHGSFVALDGVCYYDIWLGNDSPSSSVFVEFVTYYDSGQIDYFYGTISPQSIAYVPFSWTSIPEGYHTIAVDIYVNGAPWDYFIFTEYWHGTPQVSLGGIRLSSSETEAGVPLDAITMIRNTGNGAENVTLDVVLTGPGGAAPPITFNFSAPPERLLLNPPQEVTVIYPNGIIPAGSYTWDAKLRNHPSDLVSVGRTFTGSPDLSFGSVSADPPQPLALQAFNLEANLFNLGTAPAENITVEVYDGANRIGYFNTFTASPGYFYPLPFGIPENSIAAGDHSFWFKVVGYSAPCTPLNLTISGTPSLNWDGYTMTPSTPDAFDAFDIEVTLVNYGGAVAEGIVVEVLYDGYPDPVYEYPPLDFPPLGGGWILPLTVPANYTTPGEHTFLFRVKETSNQIPVTRNYPNGEPDIVFPNGITFNPADIDDPFTVFSTETSFVNNGDGWANDVVVELTVESTLYARYTAQGGDPLTVFPGATVTIPPFNFIAPPGDYTFEYKVTSAFSGASGRNTTATKSFVVTIPPPINFVCGSTVPEQLYVAWTRPPGVPEEYTESHYSLHYTGDATGVLNLEPDSSSGLTIPSGPGTYAFTLKANYSYNGTMYQSAPTAPLNVVVDPYIPPPKPNPPTGLSVVNPDPETGDKLLLSWNAVSNPNLEHYHLLRNVGFAPTAVSSGHDAHWEVRDGTTFTE